MKLTKFILATTAILAANSAHAHTGAHHFEGFISGVLHPVMGLDHLAAMLSVGIWAALLGTTAKKSIPALFASLMLLGAGIAMTGFTLPAFSFNVLEAGIASSTLVFGLMLCMAVKRTGLAAALTALFASFHGFAHGAEIAQGSSVALYALGFLSATLALTFAGSKIGEGLLAYRGQGALKGAGLIAAVVGSVFLSTSL